MPTISRYMTRQPWTIRRDARLSQARQLMREHDVRHLPVLDGGKLVGVVSQRDLYLYDRLELYDEDMTVEDAMTVDVYAVNATDPIDEIVGCMARNKYGSAIVLDRRGSVEGIFTTIDALRVLGEVLQREAA